MKQLLLVLTLFFSFTALAQDIYLQDYNYTVSDILRQGLTKDQVFNNLDRDLIKIGDSICSNRALIWAWQMQQDYNITSAKIFLFYSTKTGEVGDKTWWYHVAPMVNEGNQLWVVDGGFPRFVRSALTQDQWLKKFAGSTNCKELNSSDESLIKNMFTMQRFPAETPTGVYDCYYRIAPAPYWTPATVALNLLGRDQNGNTVEFSREVIQTGEVMSACLEAAHSPGLFGSKRKKCAKALGL